MASPSSTTTRATYTWTGELEGVTEPADGPGCAERGVLEPLRDEPEAADAPAEDVGPADAPPADDLTPPARVVEADTEEAEVE